jgi:dCMP deaminase
LTLAQNGTAKPDVASKSSSPGIGSGAPHRTGGQTFPTATDLLDFVTKRWRERWVTTSIHNEEILDLFIRRPFFILISVDAPVTVRWQRFQKRQHYHQTSPDSTLYLDNSAPTVPISEPITLESFVSQSDAHLYDPHGGLQPLISRATIRLLNTSTSLAHLYATLGKLDLANPDRLRPSWDSYFMSLASLAAQRSNCMKRRVGCVLVGREKRVISTGYNGTPRGITNCAEGGCGRCNSGNSSGVGLSTCLCLHAEENALLEAGRERIREGSVLYCDTCPCLTCSIKICQVGISEVVYAQGYSMDRETAEVFRSAGVKLRQFIPVSTVKFTVRLSVSNGGLSPQMGSFTWRRWNCTRRLGTVQQREFVRFRVFAMGLPLAQPSSARRSE